MSNKELAEQALSQACKVLEKHIGTVKADQWIKPILVLDSDNDRIVTLGIKKGLAFKWVMNNYAHDLKMYIIKFLPSCSDVIFEDIDENQVVSSYKYEDSISESQEEKVAYEKQKPHYSHEELTTSESAISESMISESTSSESITEKNGNYLTKEEIKKLKFHEKPKKHMPSFKSKTPQPAINETKTDNKLFDEVDFRLNPRYQFESFVVGETNKIACSLAQKTAEYSEPNPTLNPLFFYGGVGLGKTHLMTSIAHKYKQNFPHKNVLYISTETFMYKFIEAQRKRTNYDFKKELREFDMLLMDDIQFLVGKDSTEKEFLQVFKALDDQGKQIILSANSSPSDIKGLDDRIVSRINQGMVANIQSTDYKLRLNIIKDKTKRLTNIQIPLNVMEFLADKITNNVRELEGALKRIIQSAEITGQPINIESTKESLVDILRSNSKLADVKDIQKKVASHYNIKESDLCSKSRVRTIAMARHVAIYLSKKLTSKSQAAIGREFNRDHTTVQNSLKKINKEITSNSEIKEDIRILESQLK